MVERGDRDLRWLSLEKEISNNTAVSIIEEKLPRELKKAWALEISKSESKVSFDDKFLSLLEFLKERRRAIEYEADDMRSYTVRGDASYLEEDRKIGA